MKVNTMEATILIKGIISILTYWLQFNILFTLTLCDIDIAANITNSNMLGLNFTNGEKMLFFHHYPVII